jgi:electron transfer flavoprotein beta subunit
MKLLVCITTAPDTTTKITFTDNNTKFNEDKVQYIVNPYDEWYALVRALELKEAHGGTVTIITVGKADADANIRKALAIGADDAVRIDAESTDGYFVAAQIAGYAKDKSFDIIFCGKETISYNGSQVGSMVAEILDLPYISIATKLNVNGDIAIAEREVQGGEEVLEVKLPFVISSAKGMAEQRIPNMRGIMAARTKQLLVIAPDTTTPLTSITSYTLPPEKAGCKMISVENAGDLIALLHQEAKVI